MEEYVLKMLKKKQYFGISIWKERAASDMKWGENCIMSSATSITFPKIISVTKSRRPV
jgi:hypothetical protein